MIDRPAWYLDEYPWPPVRATPSRQPFTPGESLTLYEAARIISGRHPYPVSPDGVTTLGPRLEFIAAGATGTTRRRHRPQRGKAAFEALQQKVMSREVIAVETPRLSHPGAITDGGIDWLNVKVKTADVVALCKEKGWRPRFSVSHDTPSKRRTGRPQETHWDKVKAECSRLMDENGDFMTPVDPKWRQARLEDKLLDFCRLKLKNEPARSAIKAKLNKWLPEWRRAKQINTP
jgi:hypothetical protein